MYEKRVIASILAAAMVMSSSQPAATTIPLRRAEVPRPALPARHLKADPPRDPE